MSYSNSDKINIQQEFLREELENIQKKIEDKKSVFQKIKYEISFLNKRKKLVEEELDNFTPTNPTNITHLNTLNQSGQDFTREEAKALVLSILQEINNPDGLRISEVSQYAEQNHSNSYSNLSGSRIRRAMVDLGTEGKIIATNPDNKKFIKYVIKDKGGEDNSVEDLMK
jgi:hypothetical protein